MELIKLQLILASLYDDPQLENYDNYRDCWNGALLKATIKLGKIANQELDKDS